MDIVRFIDTLNNKDFSVQILSKQLLRSATSVGANIMEAQAATSSKDFANFISYALKSANESIFWLNLLVDTGKAGKSTFLLEETTELAKILGSSLIRLRQNRSK